MAAKVRWMQNAWWVVTHHQGRRRKKRVGAAKADKRQADEIAKKINAALALGAYEPSKVESSREAMTLHLACRWFRLEIRLPLERDLAGAVAGKTAQRHRTHLLKRILPLLGDNTVSEIDHSV